MKNINHHRRRIGGFVIGFISWFVKQKIADYAWKKHQISPFDWVFTFAYLNQIK